MSTQANPRWRSWRSAPWAIAAVLLALAAHACEPLATLGPLGSGGAGGAGGAGGTGGTGGLGTAGWGGGGSTPTGCEPPAEVSDPWQVRFELIDLDTDTPIEGALLEVSGGGATVLASGLSGSDGLVQLSVPTGGVPIDGQIMASKDGHVSTRCRVQGGFGWFDTWPVSMQREESLGSRVEALWAQPWDPAGAYVELSVLDCNERGETGLAGIMNATLSLAQPGAGLIYLNPWSSAYPELTETTSSGRAVDANVPAGDNVITLHLDGAETRHELSFDAGLREVLWLYPRGPGLTPTCSPAPTSDYVPEWKPPGGLAQGLCTDEQAEDFVAACWSGSGGCASWAEDPENAACLACAYASEFDPSWNVIVRYVEMGFLMTASAQCIAAFEGDLSANSCGAKIHMAEQCSWHACKDRCPVRAASSEEDITMILDCYYQAALQPCGSYWAEADGCSAELVGHGDPIDQCLPFGQTFHEQARRLIELLCGDGMVGAGGAGGSGAAGGAGGSGSAAGAGGGGGA